jgi:hypothetical protein
VDVIARQVAAQVAVLARHQETLRLLGSWAASVEHVAQRARRRHGMIAYRWLRQG